MCDFISALPFTGEEGLQPSCDSGPTTVSQSQLSLPSVLHGMESFLIKRHLMQFREMRGGIL